MLAEDHPFFRDGRTPAIDSFTQRLPALTSLTPLGINAGEAVGHFGDDQGDDAVELTRLSFHAVRRGLIPRMCLS